MPASLRRRTGRARVDDDGIWLPRQGEAVFDVAFDGRRVFSFWLHRDGVADAGGHRLAWPHGLREFLHGRSRVTVTDVAAGRTAYDEEVVFAGGAPDARVSVTTEDGRPLSLDKSWRRVITFDTRSPEQVAPLMRAIRDVLAALHEEGVDAFLAYGTLLGAVRDGRLIGHDSDADLGYVSHHDHPTDVARESFRLQRRMVERGYAVMRYSGAAFKVDVREPDGSIRGLDVFGGFLMDGHLHLLGEIRAPFRREWVLPLTQTHLEGWSFPAPADPDRLLAATYGASWRVPDPAFHFETPRSTHRRLNGWFRGVAIERPLWDRVYARRLDPPRIGSDTLAWVRRQEPGLTHLVDVGCGRGVDAWVAATAGVEVTGLDFSPRGWEAVAADAAADGLPLDLLELNLLDLRSVITDGALLARRRGDGPPVLMARHLVDAVGVQARAGLARLSGMLLRGGGRLYLQFLAEEGDDGITDRLLVEPRSPDVVAAAMATTGGRVVRRRTVSAGRLEGVGARGRRLRTPPARSGRRPSRICRMVVVWD